MSLTLAFDIGYASIGWCVLSAEKRGITPEFRGTGVVTFPTDDCLASQRRNLRRTRRHIRSTRMRIERMKLWLLHRGVLSREDLDRPGHPAPFLLAAAALRGLRTLTALELWTVLRWYAHNRGYDGNSRWARGEQNDEDSEKESNARSLMEEHGTHTMAETVCACLKLDPAKHAKRISSALPYKTLNAAYPRSVVEKEVVALFELHVGKIPGFDADTANGIFSPAESDNRFKRGASQEEEYCASGIKLPRRYHGGLLFGQLVPRFDNRIIARCPITWARTYDDAIAAGSSDQEARHLADKFAKVPAAKCPEFLGYRFAMLLANLKVDDGKPLPKELRQHLWNLAEKQGRLTHRDLKKEITAAGHKPYNLEATFTIHPDSENALTLDPVTEFPNKTQILKPVWEHLDKTTRDQILLLWRKGSAISLAGIGRMAGNGTAITEVLQTTHAGSLTRFRKKDAGLSYDDFLNQPLSPKKITGRAPYARPVLRRAITEVLNGHHPQKANTETDPTDGEEKPENGILYDLGIPTSRVRQLQAERPIDDLTNNHLVRHRMLILDRLVDNILAEFCSSGNEVKQVIVEVARELKEFSGMTAKQIASELNSRLKDFKAAVAYLDKHAPDLETSGGIIRKCRIAMDLDWHCPFTGESYDAYDLPNLEREHIIPYATRNTNALHALVLTWPEVNRMKGKRTARQFIDEFGGKSVEGKSNLSLFTLRNYDSFVDKLGTKGHEDDRRRKKARKALLATTDFEDKELGFTDGQLTQSSQLMKLAMGALKQKIPAAAIDPIPGPVTAEIRKSWRLTGTLAQACPEVIDEAGDVRPKNEIRGLTHLHHALDAATLALAAHYFPLRQHGKNQSGKIWQALMKRRRNEEEKKFLLELASPSIFNTYPRPSRDGRSTETDVRLSDLPPELKNALSRSLAECRVMQHVPADQSGAKAELTTWGVIADLGEESVLIGQRPTRSGLERVEDNRGSTWKNLKLTTATIEALKKHASCLSPEDLRLAQRGLLKLSEERKSKLLGVEPKHGVGKLKAIKGAMIIGENYGLALDPEPTVIPFHDVPNRLAELRAANGGKPVRVLRNGMLIRLESSPARSKQDYSGVWRITSIKNNKGSFLLDMIRPGYVTAQNGVEWSGMNKTIGPLLACGLEILPRNYCGFRSGK